MLISMTGFGEARSQAGGLAVAVEVRTINSRHFKLSYRASEGYAASSRKSKRSSARRSAAARCSSICASIAPVVGRTTIASTRRCSKTIAGSSTRSIGRSGWTDSDRLERCFRFRAWSTNRPAAELRSARRLADDRTGAPRALAADDQNAGRGRRALAADLAQQRPAVEQLLERSPSGRRKSRNRISRGLQQRVNKALSELNVTVEPADLLREVSLFADRSDISEEIVRLRSHLQQYAEALAARESSGRKLEFIAQEMGREINTIGSKANDAEISRLGRRDQEGAGTDSRADSERGVRTWNVQPAKRQNEGTNQVSSATSSAFRSQLFRMFVAMTDQSDHRQTDRPLRPVGRRQIDGAAAAAGAVSRQLAAERFGDDAAAAAGRNATASTTIS